MLHTAPNIDILSAKVFGAVSGPSHISRPVIRILTFTSLISTILALFLSSSIYFGTPLLCLGGGAIPQSVMDAHCWAKDR